MNKPQVKHYPAHGSGMIAYYDVAEMDAYLKQLEARVATLDAQKVELPEMKPYRGWLSDATRERERQLLDALRAVQAWRKVARKQNDAMKQMAQEADGGISVKTYESANSAASAYDALAGKEGE